MKQLQFSIFRLLIQFENGKDNYETQGIDALTIKEKGASIHEKRNKKTTKPTPS